MLLLVPCQLCQSQSRFGSVTARHSTSGHQPNCGVEQRAPPIFGRAAITLGIDPHSSIVLGIDAVPQPSPQTVLAERYGVARHLYGPPAVLFCTGLQYM